MYSLKSYELDALEFSCYEDPLYPFLGLAEETGELVGHVAKAVRGDKGTKEEYIKINKDNLLAEAGDVLWMLNAVVHELGSSLEEVAIANIDKLSDRSDRGVLKGSGDDR